MNRSPVFARRLSILVLAVLMFSFAGCATADKAVPGARLDLLEFLQDGTTTRAEAALRLGQPTAILERENILTFRIGEDVNKGYYVVGAPSTTGWAWETARYSLVLVFDGNGVLENHSLVLVK
jgi:hypothetical protein